MDDREAQDTRQILRWMAAWSLFCTGHVISFSYHRLAWFWYPVYNWCMAKSSNIQGNGKGPWEDKRPWLS